MIRLLLAAVIAISACATASAEPVTLYLVRHAEKMKTEGRDPALTEQGEARARALAQWLAGKEIRATWSTDYVRTRRTAMPTAESNGLDLQFYDPQQLREFATTLTTNNETALVAGHSNTTPELTALLCNCIVDAMPETEYDRLMVLRRTEKGWELETLSQSDWFNPGD